MPWTILKKGSHRDIRLLHSAPPMSVSSHDHLRRLGHFGARGIRPSAASSLCTLFKGGEPARLSE